MTTTEPDVHALWKDLEARVAAGDRFAGLFATRIADHAPVTLSAHVANAGDIDTLDVTLPPGETRYPALTRRVGAAFWYERVIHDQLGLVPEGHPRLAPLIRPGDPLPRHVEGYGLFTIPHGPVRSGVLESIEYLVETPGEAIPHLNMRVFYKHRGVARRFTGMRPPDAVLLAERTEGIASVAHALAFCHAVERMAGCAPPPAAALIRVLHAELERIANHIDVAVRLGRRGRPGRGHGPAGAAQGEGHAAGQPDVRQPLRPRRGGAGRGQRAAAAGPRRAARRGREAGQAGHRRCRAR